MGVVVNELEAMYGLVINELWMLIFMAFGTVGGPKIMVYAGVLLRPTFKALLHTTYYVSSLGST